MNFFKRLPIVTILVAVGAALYFSPEIKSFLQKNAPQGMNKFLFREPKSEA